VGKTCPGYVYNVQGVVQPFWKGPMDADKVKVIVPQCWKGPFHSWVVLKRSTRVSAAVERSKG